jgi:hypothetical protein
MSHSTNYSKDTNNTDKASKKQYLFNIKVLKLRQWNPVWGHNILILDSSWSAHWLFICPWPLSVNMAFPAVLDRTTFWRGRTAKEKENLLSEAQIFHLHGNQFSNIYPFWKYRYYEILESVMLPSSTIARRKKISISIRNTRGKKPAYLPTHC